MPGDAGVTVVTTLVCFYFLHARLRRAERPAFPAPSEFQMALHSANLAQIVRRDRGGVFLSLLREAWGGWREAPGGGLFLEVETPPPDTSLVALTMCHPPHEGGGIRKRDRGADSRRCVWSSWRGANATKQSSFLSRAAMDCLASARNDGMEDRRLEP